MEQSDVHEQQPAMKQVPRELEIKTAEKPAKRMDNYIAVFDLEPQGRVEKDISFPLSESIRRELVLSNKYEVIDRGNMNKILGEQKFQMSGCVAGQCIVEAGQLLGVGKIVAGSVSMIGKTYYLSLSLINVQTGKIENVAEEDCKCEVDDLLKSSKRLAKKLLGQKVEEDTTAAASPPKKEEATPVKSGAFANIPLNNALILGNINAAKKAIVFTDPDCLFCGRLHQEIKKVLQKRSDVAFYIKFFPLTAIHKDAYWKSKSIICNKSLQMLEDNFEKRPIPHTECNSSEIDDNIKLAVSLGINGTPTLILPDGKIHAGLLAADALIELIDGRY